MGYATEGGIAGHGGALAHHATHASLNPSA